MAAADLPDWVKPPGGDGEEGNGSSSSSSSISAARKAFFEVLKPGVNTKVREQGRGCRCDCVTTE